MGASGTGDLVATPAGAIPPRAESDTVLALTDLARFRELTYRLISQALLYPDEQCLRLVAAGARELRHGRAAFTRFVFFLDWCHLLLTADELAARAPEDIEETYMSLFMVGAPAVPCPPYESVYRGGDAPAAGWVQAQLGGRYAAAGLEVSPGVGEPPDHVALELEFMALLCGREAEAWGCDGPAPELTETAQRLQRQQSDFLEQHLGGWFPEFSALVAVVDPGGEYAALAAAAHAFITHDRDLLVALLELPAAAAEVT